MLVGGVLHDPEVVDYDVCVQSLRRHQASNRQLRRHADLATGKEAPVEVGDCVLLANKCWQKKTCRQMGEYLVCCCTEEQ